MSEQRFHTNKSPHIHISHCQGDLNINGHMGQVVDISGDDFNADMAELDQILVTSEAALEVRVPADASLTLDRVTGHLTVKHVTGQVTIKEALDAVQLKNLCSVAVHDVQGSLNGENVDGPITIVSANGDVRLRNVGTSQLEQAGGDVRIEHVTGPLNLGQVDGQLQLHAISGDLNVARLLQKAQLSNLGGRNQVADVAGEIHLAGSLTSGEHLFAAAGNIIVRWPSDAPVSLIAHAAQVRCLLALDNRVETLGEDNQTILTGHIEEGQAILSLRTPAKIGILSTYDSGAEPPDTADFLFDFHRELEPSLEAAAASPLEQPAGPSPFHEQLSAAITARLRQSGLEINPIQLRQWVDEAVAASLLDLGLPASDKSLTSGPGVTPTAGQLAAESARQAVEHSLRQAKESLERLRQQGQPPPKQPPPADQQAAPSVPPGEKMVTEEQLNILNLLRDGLITAQQAKTLLDALER